MRDPFLKSFIFVSLVLFTAGAESQAGRIADGIHSLQRITADTPLVLQTKRIEVLAEHVKSGSTFEFMMTAFFVLDGGPESFREVLLGRELILGGEYGTIQANYLKTEARFWFSFLDFLGAATQQALLEDLTEALEEDSTFLREWAKVPLSGLVGSLNAYLAEHRSDLSTPGWIDQERVVSEITARVAPLTAALCADHLFLRTPAPSKGKLRGASLESTPMSTPSTVQLFSSPALSGIGTGSSLRGGVTTPEVGGGVHSGAGRVPSTRVLGSIEEGASGVQRRLFGNEE